MKPRVPAARVRPGLVVGLLLLALGAWYAAGIGRDPVFTTGDDHAYAATAIDLAEGAPLVHRFESPALAALQLPIAGRPGAYAFRYPLGVSLLLVPFFRLGGFDGLFLLGPLMAVLGVVATHRLAWSLTRRRRVAWLAAALLATMPPVVQAASWIGSDLPSMTLVTTALVAYVGHLRQPRAARFWCFSLLAGAAVLVRNPNGLLFAAALAHQLAVHRRGLRAQAAAWGGGALIFGAFLAVQVAVGLAIFGSLAAGYAREVAGNGFSLAYLPHHLPRYLVVMCAVPPLGLVAAAVVTWRRRREDGGVYPLLLGLVLAFTVLYSTWVAFAFDPEHAFVGGARFLLPVMPILCVMTAIFALESVAALRPGYALIAACLIAQLGAGAFLTVKLRRYMARMAEHRDRIYAATSERSLVVGSKELSKLLFPRDGSGRQRRYATVEAAMRADPSGAELVRVVDAALAGGQRAYRLGSGSRQTVAERAAAAILDARYRLVQILDETSPYELRVDEILPR